MKITEEVRAAILKKCQEELKQLIRDLCAIPAPSHHEEKRAVFLKRYWQLMPVSKIAEQLHCSEARIHSMLHRLRQSLHEFLMKEGFFQ